MSDEKNDKFVGAKQGRAHTHVMQAYREIAKRFRFVFEKLANLEETEIQQSIVADLPRDLIDPPTLITVILSEAELTSTSLNMLEFGWQPSSVKDLMVRVDPARPERKERRHVHIAHRKHIRAKSKQVSWNDDGTRRDRKTFNEKLGAQEKYKNAARAALGLPDIELQWVNNQNLTIILGRRLFQGANYIVLKTSELF